MDILEAARYSEGGGEKRLNGVINAPFYPWLESAAVALAPRKPLSSDPPGNLPSVVKWTPREQRGAPARRGQRGRLSGGPACSSASGAASWHGTAPSCTPCQRQGVLLPLVEQAFLKSRSSILWEVRCSLPRQHA